MAKNVLVIGGSYFAGRVFSILASRDGGLELTVVNRGRYALGKPHVTELACDRHDTENLLALIADKSFDAVVDFCAYEAGDIAPLVRGLGKRAGQYIFLSTCSVYQAAAGSRRECDPVLEEFDEGPVGSYIRGKALLETELKDACGAAGIPYTVIRPAFIYGPFDYAPRESYFIELLVHHKPVPVPIDSTSRFSFVYVSDLARALMACCANEAAFDQTFNAAAPERIDYLGFIDVLGRIHGKPFERRNVTVSEVIEENIPLPFPLEDDELYDGSKLSNTLGLAYTPFEEGMRKTYAAFKAVFSG